jgi:acetyl esterase/lipase
MRRIGFATFALLCLAVPSRADEAQPKILADQIYGRKDGMALTLDVIKPAKPSGAAILWIQSGGWYSFWIDPKFLAAASKGFLDKGFTMVIVRHGSAPKYNIPEAVEDVRRAVRFVRLKAKDYGIDPERLGVTGGSAGGHLSLMLGTTGDDGDAKSKDEVLKQSSKVAAVVAIFPPTDLRDWVSNDKADVVKKLPAVKPPLAFDKKKAPEYSPLLKVSDKTAATLLIHGDKDELVPIDHSEKMIKALEKAKVKSKLITIKGAGHSFTQKQNTETVGPEMIAWFEKHLAKKKE